MTPGIDQKWQEKRWLPSVHVMETGSVDGDHLVTCQKPYGVELLGPVVNPGHWQAKADLGFDRTHCLIDWDKKQVSCPQGNISKKWTVRTDKTVSEVVRAQFGKKDSLACPVRSPCTRAAVNPRPIPFRQREHHEAMQEARKRQTTQEFKERSAKRAGGQGTISQGGRAFDLRVARYLGRQKTHLQHLLAATAMNVVRLFQWVMGQTPSSPSLSPFAALAL